MRAVLANVSIPRYLATAAARRLHRDGLRPMLSLRADLPVPALPAAPGWVRLRPELAGICGSDVAVVRAKSSPVLSAFYAARRQILGHEIVAVVDETGAGATTVTAGDRVVLDPVLSCVHRGFAPCRSCRDGFPYVCERFDQPGVTGCRSPTVGFDATLGGGWGEYVVAHETQLHPVAAIPSRRAVLAEPASIALHAALRWPRRGDRAVVIGPGTIGLLVTAALRRLHPDLDITVIGPGTDHPRQTDADRSDSDHPLRSGADHGLTAGDPPLRAGTDRDRPADDPPLRAGADRDRPADDPPLRAGADRVLPAGRDVVERLAELHGGRVIRPRLTRTPILERGVDVVFDCVALSETIDLGLHLLRPTGMLVLVGGAGRQPVDWSLVWNRELTVQGTVNFDPPTMRRVVEWLADPAYPVDGLVTHTFALDDWRAALDTAAAGPRAGAVKVTLRPDRRVPLVD